MGQPHRPRRHSARVATLLLAFALVTPTLVVQAGPSSAAPTQVQSALARPAALPHSMPHALPAALTGDDVFPTQAQVDAAKAAVTGAASGVAAAQARYDAATLELLRLQGVVAAATNAAAHAEDLLTQRTNEADAAAAQATRDEADATEANLAVRREAALMWQSGQGQGTDWTAYLESDGPQNFADRASALMHVGERRAATLNRAVGTARTATEARRVSDVAKEQQHQATQAAQKARAAAQAQVDSATARTVELQKQQDALVAELARLRGVAASVEQERQDALAAAEAKAAAERAAAAAAAAAQAAADAANGANSGGGGNWVPSGGLSPNEARATARSMMGNWGFGPDQWGCLDSLWTGESDWKWWARNPSSGAYGIPQSLPATKMASAGPDWLGSATTQISWGLTYIKGRYGTPCSAWSAWLARSPHWY